VESEEFYKLLLELPGVKISDVTVDLDKSGILRVQAIRKMKNGEEITYGQKFFVDKKVANTADATAVLEDGVLTIQMTKTKPEDPLNVDVLALDVETDNESTKKDWFTWNLDLPGVNISDVQVKYHDGHVHVLANRKRGDNIVKISKKVSIAEGKHDLKKLKAVLLDGVLTVSAPTLSTDSHQENEQPINIPVVKPGLSDQGGTTSTDFAAMVTSPKSDDSEPNKSNKTDWKQSKSHGCMSKIL
jgi:HSP20 family molecular chaperone IbpA